MSCETAIGTLLEAAEADTNETGRNILLGQAENLLRASGWEPLLVARLEEERGHTAEAREAYEQAGTATDVRRILRKQAAWEEAATLDSYDADLAWLLKVDRLAAAKPTGLGGRLYEQERRRLAETLEKCATTIEPERRCPDRRRQRTARRADQQRVGSGSVATGLGSVPLA